MKLFSLDWFKSEKQKELQDLQLENQKLLNTKLKNSLIPPPSVEKKDPYKKVKLVGDVLTIILHDGNILSKPDATAKDYDRAINATVESELFKIASSGEKLEESREKEKEIEKVKKTIEGFEILKGLEDFEVEGNTVYLKGIKRSLPALLVEKFAEIVTSHSHSPFEESEQYQSLKKFWLKCCVNPNARSAEDLYAFLEKHKFKIDKHGNFYAYRRVVSRGDSNKELVEFISNSYTKIKSVWKKKPSNYWVHKDISTGEFSFSTQEYSEFTDLGNLEKLYLDLPNMQEKAYTSAHTGQEDYKIGEAISMPREDGDDNNQQSCSRGYHAASKEYDYSGFGDTPILVIINPMDVLAVPHSEWGKLRTCRWFFATTLYNEEQHILDEEDFDVSELGDIFEEKCLNGMQEYVQNSIAEEVKRHTFDLAPINAKEITKIVKSLEEMKNSISKRVNVID